MYRFSASISLLLLTALSAWADPPRLVIPAEVRPSGQYVQFVPDTDAVGIVYVGLSGIDPIPPVFLADKRAFLLDVYGKPAGRYRMVAVGSGKTGEQARQDFVVVIGEPGPVPPPVPPPIPPDPTVKPDPALVAALQSAYAKETSPRKAEFLALLTEMYRTAPDQELKDASLRTMADLLGRLASVRKQLMTDTELLGTRNAIAAWLGKQLPTDPAAAVLDDALRKRTAATFQVLVASLKEVK